MRIKKTWIFFACVAICSLISANAGSDETLQVVKSYSLPVPYFSFIDFNPYDISSKGKSIWVVNENTMQVTRVDLDHLEQSLYIPVPGLFCEDICRESSFALWTCDSQKKQISLLSVPGGKIIIKFSSPGNGPAGLALHKGYLWNTDFNNNKLYQLSKVDGKILNEYNIPVFAEGMAATQEALYLIADKKIHRFDSERRTITNTYSLPFTDAMGLAWDGIYFYVSQFNSNKVSVFELR